MKIAEGEHKCYTFQELLELEDFLLRKAVTRNKRELTVHLCLDGKLVKEVVKDTDVMTSVYKLHNQVVLWTEFRVIGEHKRSFLLSYRIMDWS